VTQFISLFYSFWLALEYGGVAYPASGSEHFLIPDPNPESYMKSGMQTYFCLASYDLAKVLVFVIVQKIQDHPGGKKAPDPGSGSATLSRVRANSTGAKSAKNDAAPPCWEYGYGVNLIFCRISNRKF
jgi:hypothetical protein